MRRHACSIAVVLLAAFGLSGIWAATASAAICPVHGCYQIRETGLGPTPAAAENSAVAAMVAANCNLVDVPVNAFQALPNGTWEDHAIGICRG